MKIVRKIELIFYLIAAMLMLVYAIFNIIINNYIVSILQVIFATNLYIIYLLVRKEK